MNKLQNKKTEGRTSAIMHKKRNPMMNLKEFGAMTIKKIFKNLNKLIMKEGIDSQSSTWRVSTYKLVQLEEGEQA